MISLNDFSEIDFCKKLESASDDIVLSDEKNKDFLLYL